MRTMKPQHPLNIQLPKRATMKRTFKSDIHFFFNEKHNLKNCYPIYQLINCPASQRIPQYTKSGSEILLYILECTDYSINQWFI